MPLTRAYSADETPQGIDLPSAYIVIRAAEVSLPSFALPVEWYASREAYLAGKQPWRREVFRGEVGDDALGQALGVAAAALYTWLRDQIPGSQEE